VCQSAGNRLAPPIITLILARIREINQRFARLVARISAGTYAPRRISGPRRSTPRRPRPPNPLPQTFGWLHQMIPEVVGYRSQLEYLLRDPEMVALMQAAPGALRRPIRSLCRALRVEPPEILALPKKPRPPRPPRQPRPKREPLPPYYPPTPSQMPGWWVDPPRLTRWPFLRTRRLPKPKTP
jgi:hypothetical protein